MARNPDREKTFRFKRFELSNSASAMKVGTDGVLLGAWAGCPVGCSALDIGCGTGLIALMLAQRGAGRIVGVEIDPVAAAEARGNVAASPWSGSVDTVCADFAEYAREAAAAGLRFDLIVSNPPYFVGGALAPDASRRTARHESSLSATSVLEAAPALLSPQGRVALVVPADRETDVTFVATLAGLSPTRLCRVATVGGRAPTRLLAEFASASLRLPCVEEALTVRDSNANYSENYIQLTKDFYLNF